MKPAVLAIVALALTGCVGPLTNDAAPRDPQFTDTLSSTIPTVDAAPLGSQDLGEVTATSCMNKAWDPAPTNENATAQLRIFARERGANAISQLVCAPDSVALIKNCWAGIVCKAKALKIPDKRR